MEELKHHGIKGQKWGVQNGPPYPLDESQYSGKEKKFAKNVNKLGRDIYDRRVNAAAYDKYYRSLGLHPDMDPESQEFQDIVQNYKPPTTEQLLKYAKEYINSSEGKKVMNGSYQDAYDFYMQLNEIDRKQTRDVVKTTIASLSLLGVFAAGGVVSGLIGR